MQNSQQTRQAETRDYRLDIIKAICILLVLIWHLQPIDISAPELQAHNINLFIKESIITFYLQITLLAVPTFILVSVYIYLKKLAEKGIEYFPKRFFHLLVLFVFWLFIQTLVFYLVAVPKSIPLGEQIAKILKTIGLSSIFLNGGPSLPNVGGSVFYFISLLFQLTILATLFFYSTKTKAVADVVGFGVIITSIVYMEAIALKGSQVKVGGIQGYALYIPIAYYLYKSEPKFSKLLFFSLIAIYLLFSIQDYLLRTQEIPYNVYARPSIVFGATALFYGCKNIHLPNENRLTKFLSEYSLGIFGLHKYFQYISIVTLTPFFIAWGIAKKVPLGYLRVNVQTLIIALVTVTLTFVCIYLLDKTPLRRFIK